MSAVDTIVAVSSVPGSSPRGIVRLSGPDAFALASRVFVHRDHIERHQWRAFHCHPGEVRLDTDIHLPAEIYAFRSPRSYTGEDCVEIHTIGAPPLLEMVFELLVRAGARQATPGEFTAQALLNGRLDLAQAEGVAALIHAESDAQLRAAMSMRSGDLSRALEAWQIQIVDLTALVEAEIDFAEEPIDFITPAEIRSRLESLMDHVDALARSADQAARSDVLPRVLLIGLPNAGKSTLMNTLSGIDRSMCSPIPGTTRDILSATVNLGTHEVQLLDAAGVARSEQVELMQIARQRALDEASRCDVVALVVDAAGPFVAEDYEWFDRTLNIPGLLILNKCDLNLQVPTGAMESLFAPFRFRAACRISAITGEGVESLKVALAELTSTERDHGDAPALQVNLRQRQALHEAREALALAVKETLECGETLDRAEFIAAGLHEALDALKSVTGEVTTDDLLASVFSNFCIGK